MLVEEFIVSRIVVFDRGNILLQVVVIRVLGNYY
jgi:hypothetical protein